MGTADSYYVDNDEVFQEIRQGIVDAIYGKDMQTVFAVLRDVFIFSMAQCDPAARWDIAANFRRDASRMLTESNEMAEAVRKDPSIAGLPSLALHDVIHFVPNGATHGKRPQ
jgi:hypothetical protein